jgi:uncharacterized repeat protein (TIGR01451 family)
LRAVTAVVIVIAALLALPGAATAAVFDLEVTSFTPSVNPVPEEGNVDYAFVVKNNGPETVTNVSVVVSVPASMFTYVSGGNFHSANTATFTFASIGVGNSVGDSSTWKGAHPGTGAATADASAAGTDQNDGNSRKSVQATVTGLSATPPTVSMGDQVVFTTGPLVPVVFTNGSAVPVSPSADAVTGDMGELALAAGCITTIAPGDTCTQSYRFLPAALGPRTAHVTFGTSSAVDPVTVDFTGNGIAAPTIAGPVGPQGPAGPAGPAGPPAFKLVVVPVSTKLRARAGKKVTFSYVSTLDATARLDVLKGSKRVARVTGSAKTGLNKLRWNGKTGRKAASAGAYKLRLTAVNGSQTVTANAKLTLR